MTPPPLFIGQLNFFFFSGHVLLIHVCIICSAVCSVALLSSLHTFENVFFFFRRAPSIATPDGGTPVSPQVSTPAPRGGSQRGWDRGHQPTRKSADFHLHGDAVHRRHSLPEHRCKTAQRRPLVHS